MQLANLDILDQSIFRDIGRSAGPILHDMDRTLTASKKNNRTEKCIGSLAARVMRKAPSAIAGTEGIDCTEKCQLGCAILF